MGDARAARPARRRSRAACSLVAAGVAVFWLVVRWLLAPRDWSISRTFRLATPARYAQIVLLRAPMFFVSLCLHYYAAHAFGIRIPFGQMLTFLPVIFMLAALPVTVAHLGTTQAAWIFFFSQYAPVPRLLAFSLAAHLVFSLTRAMLGRRLAAGRLLRSAAADAAAGIGRRDTGSGRRRRAMPPRVDRVVTSAWNLL